MRPRPASGAFTSVLVTAGTTRDLADHLTEQVDGLTSRYARRSPPLHTMPGAVALALAGRAGARLAGVLGAVAGRSSLLRLIRALPDPEAGTVTVPGSMILPCAAGMCTALS